MFQVIEQKWKKILWGIITASFLLSLAHSFYFRIEPTVDAGAYDRIAVNVLNGEGYRQNFDLQFEKDNAIGRVGPGYEFFLVGVYYVFGHRYEAIWILQAIFHALSVLLVFLIAQKVFYSQRVLPSGKTSGVAPTPDVEEGATFQVGIASIIASAIFGFYPDLIVGSSMLLAETLAIFLMLVSVYIFFRLFSKTSGVPRTPHVEDKRSRNTHLLLTVLLGAIFAFSVLVRTPLLLILLPIIYFFYSRKLFLNLALLILVIAAVMAPWTIRNFKVYGAFIPTSLTFGDDLLSGNHPGSSGELDDTRVQFTAKYNDYDMVTADRLSAKEAIIFILTNPLEFFKITLFRISMYFSFIRPTGWWPYLNGSIWQPLVLLLSSFWSAIIFTCGFFGVWEAIRKVNGSIKYLLMFLTAVVLPVIFIVVETRYRYPSYAFFAVFGGLGFVSAAKLIGNKPVQNLKQLLIVFLFVFGNTVFDILRNFERIRERISGLI